MTPTPDSLLQLCAGAAPLLHSETRFSLLRVRGPDAADFLHRLSSQEIHELGAEASARAAFLDPKGKLLAVATIAREGETLFVETPIETAEGLFEVLDRYHFTEKLTIERLSGGASTGADSPDWPAVELLGSGAGAALGLEPGAARVGEKGLLLSGIRHGVESVRAYGEEVGRIGTESFGPGDRDRAERLRILSGLPKVGVDTGPTTLALEADLDDHVSTTKGCYTGQEIVARIHTYGHVNRKLVRLFLSGAGPVEKDTPLCLVDGGVPLGRVTSAVDLPDGSGRLALGYLPGPFLDEPEPIALGVEGGSPVEILGAESASR